jgi:lanosterol synthase
MTTRKRAESGPNLEDIKYPQTDHSRWRLRDDNGRQTWHYLQTDEDIKQWPLNTADKYHLGLDTVRIPVPDTRLDIH